MMDETIKTYDQVAEGYDEQNFSTEWYKKEFGMFRRLLPKGQILDIGCGAGRDTVLFLKAGYKYVGIDASKTMLKLARKRNKRAKFLLRNFYKLNFSKNSFDGFWAGASLPHVPGEKIGEVLGSIREILKDRGVGFVSVRRRNTSFKQGIILEVKYGRLIKRHFTHYTQGGLKKVLEEAGFKVVKIFQKGNTNGEKISWLHAFVEKA